MNIDWSKIQTAEEKELEEQKRQKRNRHFEILENLRNSDYVALSDYDKDKPEIIAQRAEWRAEIREIEDWLEQNEPAEQAQPSEEGNI